MLCAVPPLISVGWGGVAEWFRNLKVNTVAKELIMIRHSMNCENRKKSLLSEECDSKQIVIINIYSREQDDLTNIQPCHGSRLWGSSHKRRS